MTTADAAPTPATTSTPGIGSAPAAPPPPAAILLVDDNATKRLALRAVLAPLGHPVVEAASGRAALRCLLTQDFAVILLDVRMPLMDGFETAALIRQRRQSEMTPIIFITAFAVDDIGPERYVEGAVDFMFAPIPPEELRAKVSVFIKLYIKAEALAREASAVRTSADQLRLLTDAAPIGIFQTDLDDRYVYTNPRWTDITGITADAALGQRWDFIMHGDPRAGGPDGAVTLDGAVTPGIPVDELSHRFVLSQLPTDEVGGSPPGGHKVLLLTAKLVPGVQGGTTGWVGTLADVTAEAGAEAAMAAARDSADEASRLKSDFLANMSHEIRTPMNGVIGMTDLLLETALDGRQRDYALTVRNSGEALLTIVNDILDFSKIEAGELSVEHVDFDPRLVVENVISLLATLARSKGLEISAVVEPAVPARVIGDPGRVRQVLTNLIGNATKFTQEGTIVVRVGATPVADEDVLVRFEIVDTGDGIAADKLEAVFQPFVQADSSTSRKYGGTGLGLSISAQLVALMGGACGVVSELGVGSTFWFTIAVRLAPDPTPPGPDPAGRAASAPEPAGPAATAPGAGRLLLAEDNPINRKVAEAMLSNAGYRVDSVVDGAEAVRAVAAGPYAAVLMDCQMPEMNGYEATAAIRGLPGPVSRIPIIAMTASARQEDRERCLAAGMDSYLSKPVSKDALLALVARFMSGDSVPPVARVPEAAGVTEAAGVPAGVGSAAD